MKCYVTSVGEKTTKICVEQLRKFGYEVILLDKNEPWFDKYVDFIHTAAETGENCLKVDADIIVNKNIQFFQGQFFLDSLENQGPERKMMIQAMGWDYYKNMEGVIGIVYYTAECLRLIENNIHNLDMSRPEASAWRLQEVNGHTLTMTQFLMGIHGLAQDEATIQRAINNKIARKQIGDYDFDLVNKINDIPLWQK